METLQTSTNLNRALLDFDMEDVVAWFASEKAIPASLVSEMAREIKRFLALRAANPDVKYAMAGPVDELWHYFVLATEQYSKFCELAGRFLHHRPGALSREEDEGSYERFLADYAIAFGESAPAEFWPALDFMQQVSAGADCGVCT